MTEWEVVGYHVTPILVKVKAETAGEAYDIGKDLLTSGHGVELEGAWQDDFIVYDKDGDEVPESDLYELGN